MDEALEEIGHVSGEGGPLLLADLITVTSWRGVEEGGKDYERACDLLAEGSGGEGCAIAGRDRRCLGNGGRWDCSCFPTRPGLCRRDPNLARRP
jgi:hypothetical protein